MHFEQDLCFIDSAGSGSQFYINCIQSLDPFLSSLSSNVNLDLQQFVNLFISLFGEKSLFSLSCWMDQSLGFFQFISRIDWSGLFFILFSGSRKSGRGGTTRRCWNMKSSSWAVTTMSAESKHRKWPRVRNISDKTITV